MLTYEESHEFMKSAFAKKTAPRDFPLPYRMLLPRNYSPAEKYPVLLLLHGLGECGKDNEAQFRNGFPQLFRDPDSLAYKAIVIAPQCDRDCLWVDPDLDHIPCGPYKLSGQNESRSLIAVNAILDEIMAKYSCDEDRVYVAGISLGAYGTWDLLLRHTDRFAAAMPVCGAGDFENAHLAAAIPVRVYHGDCDTSVKVEGSRLMVEALLRAGNKNVYYKEYEGRDHDIWNDAYADSEALKWLFSWKRGHA